MIIIVRAPPALIVQLLTILDVRHLVLRLVRLPVMAMVYVLPGVQLAAPRVILILQAVIVFTIVLQKPELIVLAPASVLIPILTNHLAILILQVALAITMAAPAVLILAGQPVHIVIIVALGHVVTVLPMVAIIPILQSVHLVKRAILAVSAKQVVRVL